MQSTTKKSGPWKVLQNGTCVKFGRCDVSRIIPRVDSFVTFTYIWCYFNTGVYWTSILLLLMHYRTSCPFGMGGFTIVSARVRDHFSSALPRWSFWSRRNSADYGSYWYRLRSHSGHQGRSGGIRRRSALLEGTRRCRRHSAETSERGFGCIRHILIITKINAFIWSWVRSYYCLGRKINIWTINTICNS